MLLIEPPSERPTVPRKKGVARYPVHKALQFITEQWEQVRVFRFEQKISTEADAVRRLIQVGLEATAAKSQPAKRPIKPPKPAKRTAD